MRVYAIVDDRGKILQSNPQFKGIYGCLIFQLKSDAISFRDTEMTCWWKDVYKHCRIKRFDIKGIIK